MRRCLFLLGLCAAAALAQTPKALEFLVGTWATNGDSELGRCEGSTTFAPEAGGQVLVRRGWLKFTSGQNAGTRHEDLLVVYAEGSALRAIYFDGEGHVIRYGVTVSSPGVALFESDVSAKPGPRFRLTHAAKGAEMRTNFEIAPPFDQAVGPPGAVSWPS